MVQVWGKIYKGEKIFKSVTVDVDEHTCTFFDMLRIVCEKLDSPTPVLLEKHVNDFNMFNLSIFKPDDYIQPVNFSRLVLENLGSGEN